MLAGATAGVLALLGPDGYPYAVPLSFVHEGDSIYFHCARAGHKLDAIAHCDKASFCVIADDEVVQSAFTTHFRSVIAFGRVSVVADSEHRRHALRLLAQKYSPDYVDQADSEIERSWDRMEVLELAVEELTGKAAIEVIKERETGASAAE